MIWCEERANDISYVVAAVMFSGPIFSVSNVSSPSSSSSMYSSHPVQVWFRNCCSVASYSWRVRYVGAPIRGGSVGGGSGGPAQASRTWEG